MKLRAALAGVALGAILIGALAGSASADLEDYLANPGRQTATDLGAQCESGAGSGAFGYFGGKDNNLGIPDADGVHGATGELTGLNNSSVCGNRQGNLP